MIRCKTLRFFSNPSCLTLTRCLSTYLMWLMIKSQRLAGVPSAQNLSNRLRMFEFPSEDYIESLTSRLLACFLFLALAFSFTINFFFITATTHHHGWLLGLLPLRYLLHHQILKNSLNWINFHHQVDRLNHTVRPSHGLDRYRTDSTPDFIKLNPKFAEQLLRH